MAGAVGLSADGTGGRRLVDRILPAAGVEPADILARFLDWVASTGLSAYPEQEEALWALALEQHVILGTPTGSGKSLVALGLHFKAMCEGVRSFYTSPTKALASEKFFALCDTLGPGNVGMLTGDASINRDASVICCTAEVLSQMCLRQGARDAPGYVVMDEFHFYADPERGVAWQVPLLVLRDTRFLLMSATLGDTRHIADRLTTETGRPVATVVSDRRPVPLDFEYRETPLHETVQALMAARKAPIYIVSFTHRECATIAQALTSAHVVAAEERRRIDAAVAETRFDTPFGRELRRYLHFGIGVHHAGLLPKYRLLVERLAQRGLLGVVSGTDTLGVGVNMPIRTVLFARLAKYDGHKVAVITAREFRQIAGRAGRKGFDDRGSVVCQAPEHVIEAQRRKARANADGRRRTPVRKAPPGAVVWNRQTFEQLVSRAPEPLASRFRVSHGMVLAVLQRPVDAAGAGAYADLVDLVWRCHEDLATRRRLLREAARLFRSLRGAELVAVAPRVPGGHRATVVVDPDLQVDFSLHESLSLFLVETLPRLDSGSPAYALDVVTLAEAILEDPVPILRAQADRARSQLLARLKADDVPYEERKAMVEAVTWPQPRLEFIRHAFEAFTRRHPWLRHDDIRPKSVARDLLERGLPFASYVERYGVQRSEGLLLRHLGQVYETLAQTVPDAARTEALATAMAALRGVIDDTDASLLEAWERLQALAEAEL